MVWPLVDLSSSGPFVATYRLQIFSPIKFSPSKSASSWRTASRDCSHLRIAASRSARCASTAARLASTHARYSGVVSLSVMVTSWPTSIVFLWPVSWYHTLERKKLSMVWI